MSYWLKKGYFDRAAGEGIVGYWDRRGWVNDGPGVESEVWRDREQPEIGEEYPFTGPRYEVGDRLVAYVRGIGCVAVLEASGLPRWDPATVAAAGTSDESRWAVITPVSEVLNVGEERAVAPTEFGVTAGQGGRTKLTEAEYEQAWTLLDRGRVEPDLAPEVDVVPLSQPAVSDYTVASRTEVTQATRREAQLVDDYRLHMERQGERISCLRARPAGGARIVNDILNEARDQIIEAKATTRRSDVRMAIGQLADYGRFRESARRAVLLPERPASDLISLLEEQGIAVVWKETAQNGGFVDNAGGEFV